MPDVMGHELNIAHSSGMEAETAPTVRVPVGQGIAGRVLKSRESIVLNSEDDIQSPSGSYDSPFFVSAPILSTPLGSAGKVEGVLNATVRSGGNTTKPLDAERLIN